MNPRVIPFLAAALLLGAGSAKAHNPVCFCEAAGPDQIRCIGGFSDGADAPGVPVEVRSYSEQVLLSGALDSQSTFQFQRPAGEFYVLFDAGPGHTVEIDHVSIK
jgi:hypothetical protein